MITYRIDNRPYEPQGIIMPQNLYFSRLKDNHLKVEELLELHRPENKPTRNSILMLFEDFENAKIHWTRQIDAKFYRTVIADNDVLHIGDYNLIEEIFQHLKDDNLCDAQATAISYWRSSMSANPIKEIFVNQAPVTQIVSNSEDERTNEKWIHLKQTFAVKPNIRRILQ